MAYPMARKATGSTRMGFERNVCRSEVCLRLYKIRLDFHRCTLISLDIGSVSAGTREGCGTINPALRGCPSSLDLPFCCLEASWEHHEPTLVDAVRSAWIVSSTPCCLLIIYILPLEASWTYHLVTLVDAVLEHFPSGSWTAISRFSLNCINSWWPPTHIIFQQHKIHIISTFSSVRRTPGNTTSVLWRTADNKIT